jgi:hypothetical protein
MYKTNFENFIKILKCTNPNLIFMNTPPLLVPDETNLKEMGYEVVNIEKQNKKVVQRLVSSGQQKIFIHGFMETKEIKEIFGNADYMNCYYFPNNKNEYLKHVKKNCDSEKVAKILKDPPQDVKLLTIALYKLQNEKYEKFIKENTVLVVLL